MKYAWLVQAGMAAYQIHQGNKAKKKAAKAQAQAEAAAAPYLEAYKSYEYKNPYEGMENVYEDMRINTQAAEFQKEQMAQQQADILQGLQGSAGGAGVAALAQSMARAGAVQAQKASADISRQETAREQAQLAEQSRIQGLQRYGEQLVDQQEMQRNMNLYSLEMGKAGLATEQKQQAQQQMMGGIGNLVSAGISGYSSGAFGGGGQPSVSNLEMASGSTLPGNTLDSSTMSSFYGGPNYEVVPGYVSPTLTTEGQINTNGGFPSYNLYE